MKKSEVYVNSTPHRRRRLCVWLASVTLVLILILTLHELSWPQTKVAPALELQPVHAVVWQDFLGVNAHWLWFSPEQRRQQSAALQALGLKWVRLDLHWDRIEPKSGQFLWKVLDPVMQEIADDHLQAEVYLVGSAAFDSSAPAGAPYSDKYPPRDLKRYAQTLATLARRYPQIAVWQVWNEPNLPGFWYPRADPETYGHLLDISYQTLQNLPQAPQIAVGGMAYYSQMSGRSRPPLMIQALGERGLFGLHTIIAYHPYSLYPLGDQPEEQDFVRRSIEVNQILRAAGATQIWADEWGWSSYTGPKEEQPIIGEDGQADYVLQRLALMSALDYDKIFLFALSDLDAHASQRDQSYGLLNLAGTPKPAYRALARFLDITGPRLLPGTPPPDLQAATGLVGIGWQRPDGSRLWMFWSDHETTLSLPTLPDATLYSPLDGSQQILKDLNGRIAVPVTTHFQILEWRP